MFTAIVFLVLFPALLVAFWLFDRLVKIEYERHRASWEEDGRPIGFLWAPAEGRNIVPVLRSSWARNVCCLTWLCGTPDWMRSEPKALKMAVWYRVLVIVWNVGLVGAIAVEPASKR